MSFRSALIASIASLLLLVACGEERETPPPGETPIATAAASGAPALPVGVPPIDLAAAEERLGPDVWGEVEAAAWFDGEDSSADGRRLLAALASAGPLASDERLLAILATYPDGIDAMRLDVAERYARLTFGNLHDVLVEAWLANGLDAYERAIMAIVAERAVSPSAMRLSLRESFFRDVYDANPELLTSRMIDAVGTLNSRLLARAEQETWYQDGLDEADVSLLGVLAEFVRVEDALTVLDEGAYRALELANSTIMVAFVQGTPEQRELAYSLVAENAAAVEAFVGDFQPLGLLLDLTPIDDYIFCHGDGGSEYSVGYVGFTGPDCLNTEVVVHELAHAFLGGRYPPWFSEGAAELVSFHVYGGRSGYYGGRGLIDLDGFFFTGSPEYLNQGALGADFLEAAYHLAGEGETSRLLRDLAGRRLTGGQVLERIREAGRGDVVAMEQLILEYFGSQPEGPGAAVPAPGR